MQKKLYQTFPIKLMGKGARGVRKSAIRKLQKGWVIKSLSDRTGDAGKGKKKLVKKLNWGEGGITKSEGARISNEERASLASKKGYMSLRIFGEGGEQEPWGDQGIDEVDRKSWGIFSKGIVNYLRGVVILEHFNELRHVLRNTGLLEKTRRKERKNRRKARPLIFVVKIPF